MLNGATVMDASLIVIGSDQTCPQVFIKFCFRFVPLTNYLAPNQRALGGTQYDGH